MNDSTLIKTYLAGDQAAFAELVARHGGMVLAAARRMAKEDAEDVAQAVFILLSQKVSTLPSHPNLAGWLHETTRHCASAARRLRARRHAREAAYHEAAMNRTAADPSALLDRLDEGLAKLSKPYREVLLMRYLEERSVDETAATLGLSPAAVMKRSTRGLGKLRDYFARHGVETTTPSLTLCLAGQSILLPAQQQAAFSSPVAGATPAVVQLAGAARHTLMLATLKPAAAAALVGVTIIGAGTSWVAIRHFKNPSASNIVAATTASSAVLPISRGDDARQVAEAFLAALRAGDVAAVAATLNGSDAKRTAAAEKYVRDIRNGDYSRFPERLALIELASGERARPIESGDKLFTQSPTDADGRSLAVTTKVAGGRAFVDSAEVEDSYGFIYRPDPSIDRVGNGGPPLDYAAAAMLFERFAKSGEWGRMKDENRAAILVDLARSRVQLKQLIALARKSDMPPAAGQAEAIEAFQERFETAIRERGVAAAVEEGERLQNDAASAPAFDWFERFGKMCMARADAEEGDSRDAVRLPAVEPDVVLKRKGEGSAVTVPGALQLPAWLRESNGFKRGQDAGDTRPLGTRDGDDNLYVVDVTFAKTADGKAHERAGQIVMYRPDNTRAAVAYRNALNQRTLSIVYDRTGSKRVWLISYNTRDGVTWIDQAIRYDEAGNQRRYRIDPSLMIEKETVADPIGEHEVVIEPAGNVSK